MRHPSEHLSPSAILDATREWEDAKAEAMATPETAIAWHVDNTESADAHNFWTDTFHDLVKQIGSIWYDPFDGTLAFVTDYAEDATQALATLASRPQAFGRLAHPVDDHDMHKLVWAIKRDLIWPSVDTCAHRANDYFSSLQALDTFGNSSPRLASLVDHHRTELARHQNRLDEAFLAMITHHTTTTPNPTQPRPTRRRNRHSDR